MTEKKKKLSKKKIERKNKNWKIESNEGRRKKMRGLGNRR